MEHSLPKAGYFLRVEKLIDVTVLFCYSYGYRNPSTFGRKRASYSGRGLPREWSQLWPWNSVMRVHYVCVLSEMAESLRVRVGAVALVLVTFAAIVFAALNFRQSM